MEKRLLTKAELKELYESELKDTFPPAELKPFRAIETLMDRNAYEPISFWEAGTLVAYALLWKAPEVKYVLLDYLGVTAARRGGGIGSQALKALTDVCRGRWDGILAEVENPDPASADYEQQTRRIRFYERCGYRYAGYDIGLFGVHYKVYAQGDLDAARMMADQSTIYRTELKPALFEQVVQLPLKEGETVHPLRAWEED